MARLRVIEDRDLVESARRLVIAGGPKAATVHAIARGAGVPVGSVYHRFASRDELLARLWLDTVTHFQRGFLDALAIPHPLAAGEAAAVHTPRYARTNPGNARLLLVHRQSDFVGPQWPEDLRERARDVNAEATEAVRRLARAIVGNATAPTMRKFRYVLVGAPTAAVRPHLEAGEPVPRDVDDMVRRTYRAVIR